MCYNGHKQESTDLVRTIPELLKDVPVRSIDIKFSQEKDNVIFNVWHKVNNVLKSVRK